MQRYAIIQNGFVIGKIWAQADNLPQETGETYVASDVADLGWTYDASTSELVAPQDPAPVSVSLESYANLKQWSLATGGYTATVGGAARFFKTDDMTRGLITSKQLRLQQANPPTLVNWQFEDGFAEIASADFTAAAIKVADFFQATFDAIEAVLAAIAAGTITSEAQVDAAAWPANHD